MQKINLTGSYFKCGYKIGEIKKNIIRGYLERDKALLHKAKEHHWSDILKFFENTAVLHGRFIEELAGIAQGAGVDFIDVFLENCPEILAKTSGCTTVFVNGQGGSFLLHNEDEDSWRADDNYVLLSYKLQNGLKYHGVASPPELCGNSFGWNGHLVYSVDYLPSQKYLTGGVPRYFEDRGLLEQKSIKGVIKYLGSFKSASSWHYLIAEFNGPAVSIERSGGSLSVKKLKDLYIHTNHYLHEPFRRRENYIPEITLRRLKIAGHEFHKDISQKSALSIMKNKLFRPLDASDTAKTFAVIMADLKSKKIKIDSAP